MGSLYHHMAEKSNINSQENTAEKTFHFPRFFCQSDEIRMFPIIGESEIMFEIVLVGWGRI